MLGEYVCLQQQNHCIASRKLCEKRDLKTDGTTLKTKLLTCSCRSPMAEAVFASVVKEKGYDDRFETIDSFGTSGWHVGEPPDHRSSSCCRSHGVPVKPSAQQIRGEDFKRFDYIIGMDSSNLNNLKRIQPKGNKSVVELFGNWRTDKSVAYEVQDPYYGGKDGFETNFKQLKHFSEVFLEREVDRK